MRIHIVHPGRRFGPAAATAVAAALMSAGPALAAGSGYGSTQPSSNTPPSGFTSVVAAKTVNSGGGSVGAKTSGGSVLIQVPKGASRTSLQVAITKGSLTVAGSRLTGSLQHDKVIAAFGIELRHGSSSAVATESLTLSFSAIKIKPGDFVAIYDAKTRKFRRVSASVHDGEVVVKLTASESIAIVAPGK